MVTADEYLYDRDGIRVTETALSVRGREYPLVTAIAAHLSAHRADVGSLWVRAAVGAGLAAVGGVLVLIGEPAGITVALLGGLLSTLTVLRIRTRGAIFRLRLETERGDLTVAADTDEADMRQLLAAVRSAIERSPGRRPHK